MDSDSGNCRRIIIEAVSPEVDGGRYPAKAVIGDDITVTADIYADGHDSLSARVLFRHEHESDWVETPMRHLGNDRWEGLFPAARTGTYYFAITAWVDRFLTWQKDLAKRVKAGEKDLGLQMRIGAGMMAEAASRAGWPDLEKLTGIIATLNSPKISQAKKATLALGDEARALMDKYAERGSAVTYERQPAVYVDRARAGFSAWYEMFPRSSAAEPGRHGTFRDCEARLPYIAAMGFDVLYLPPIHPIGHTNRKGKNNSVTAGPDDPGTPWAIGSEEGGHKAIDPRLGSLADFKQLVAAAGRHGIEIALDIAFQCSPDHPYVKQHPEWFTRLPDGTIQYAENPPKKYQDIYPLNFGTEHRQELWEELKSIVIYWAEQGVRIFRVDNPHTKPFCFWEWLLAEVKKDYPDAIFLAEAFTRPKVMYRLARLGFTLSYTYFTWRNHKKDIAEYLTELTQTPVRDFFRPIFWPNTPDILHEYLQTGGRPAFITRLVLAATLSANYGIYGPAFELMARQPREPGSEEYLDSEKYEIKHWDIDRADSLAGLIGVVNRIRRENPALQRNRNLWFNATDNDHLLCYSKHTEDLADIVLVVVNLDPAHTQSGRINVPLGSWGLDGRQSFRVRDLLSGAEYTWTGEWNYVQLDPAVSPAHILRVVDNEKLRRKSLVDNE
jgi:starch synthase (maltosyl-transferring)